MNKTQVTFDDSRTLNKPAWTTSSLNQEGPIHSLGTRIEGTDEVIEPIALPAFALIRTTRAIYDRVKIIRETRDKFRITYRTINRRGIPEVQTEDIEKQNIRTFRLYSE